MKPTKAYNEYLRAKIEVNDLYDKDVIAHEKWKQTLKTAILELYNVHPKIAKREAKKYGFDVEWPNNNACKS